MSKPLKKHDLKVTCVKQEHRAETYKGRVATAFTCKVTWVEYPGPWYDRPQPVERSVVCAPVVALTLSDAVAYVEQELS